MVVGELNADLVLSGDVTPAFGQVEKLIADATLTIGSSSAIFACGAAKLGLRVAFIGKAGQDEFGQFMLRELTARGIDTSGVVISSHVKTGLSIIFSQGNDRAILTYSGSIAALSYDEINLDLLARARHLHLGSYFLLDALRPDVPALFQTAHENHLSVSLDTNYDPTEKWDGGLDEVLRHTDVFLPNEAELRAITGTNTVEAGLSKLEVPLIAVKCGANGAMARWRKNIVQTKSFPVEVVDTTGAGDSFDAGFIYGYLAGWPLERSLRFACACGSLSTQAAGGTASQATPSQAFNLIERYP